MASLPMIQGGGKLTKVGQYAGSFVQSYDVPTDITLDAGEYIVVHDCISVSQGFGFYRKTFKSITGATVLETDGNTHKISVPTSGTVRFVGDGYAPNAGWRACNFITIFK